MNFTRVRRDVPLSDSDYASIRRSVMREIETVAGRRSPVAGGGWWLAAAAAVMAITFLVWPKREDGLKPVPHHVVTVVAAAPAAVPATGERRPATVRRHHHVAHPKPAPQIATRMEIQTADPDVRIIWITR